MINMTEGGFAEIWEGEKSPEVQAISYALQMAVGRVVRSAEGTKCFSDIDKLPETALDYFAVEMRTMYYSQSMPIETKRAIVKNTLNWYTKGGTPSAVKELLTVVFGKGDLEEWFEYGGEPYHFTAVIPISKGDAVGDMDLFRELINKLKNVRSHCDELILQDESVLKLKTEGSGYIVEPPLCGTLPSVSTAFSEEQAQLSMHTADAEGTAAISYSSESDAGTEPITSTAFASSDMAVTMEKSGMIGAADIERSGTSKANE